MISQIEFLAFSGLTQDDCDLFSQFLQRVSVIGLEADDEGLIAKIIEVRQQYRLKLPDAVIAAMAIQNAAIWVTADREFSKVPVLNVVNW